MVLVITPAIMMIRLERLISYVLLDDVERSIILCRKYVKDLENKSISNTTTSVPRQLAEELFEVELLITLEAMTSASIRLKTLNDKIIKMLVNYHIFRNRLINVVSDESTIGTLYVLPTDCLIEIVDKLQIEYIW